MARLIRRGSEGYTAPAGDDEVEKNPQFHILEGTGFYAALYPVSFGEMVIGGKNPLEAEKWPRMSGLSVEGSMNSSGVGVICVWAMSRVPSYTP